MLSSDEDDIDEEGQEYLESLQRQVTAAGAVGGFPINATINDISAGSDDSDSDYENEDTVLEAYSTPLDEEDCDIDEYMVFKEVMQSKCSRVKRKAAFSYFIVGLQSTEPEWYNLLTSNLTEQQQKALMEVSVLADQRRAARESKKIEQQGGK